MCSLMAPNFLAYMKCLWCRFDLQVDVVLSDDRGFWNAIETFMNITKRPIVMTASDHRFISRFPCRVELLKLHTPQHVSSSCPVCCLLWIVLHFICLQCFDTVGWVTGMACGLWRTECWYSGVDNLAETFHMLEFHYSSQGKRKGIWPIRNIVLYCIIL